MSAVAALAHEVGDRSWRSWAGRTGGDEFKPTDVFRGATRFMRWHLRAASGSVSKTQTCPICYDSFPRDDLLHFSCGHAVCRSCGERLAEMQVGAYGATRNRLTIRACALCRQTVSAAIVVKQESPP